MTSKYNFTPPHGYIEPKRFSREALHFIPTHLSSRSSSAIARMPGLSYCFCFAFAVIAVGAINKAGASPRSVLQGDQDLQNIIDSIQELAKAVSNCRTESVQEVAEVLRNQQTALSEIVSNTVSKSPPVCQPMGYELVFQLGEFKHKFEEFFPLFEAADNKIKHLEGRLPQLETTSSQAKEKSINNEIKIRDLVRKVEAISNDFCRSPFYRVGQDCLYIDLALQRSWSACRAFCRAFGGDLAVPSDVIKLRGFLATFNKDWNYWIGGSDLDKEGDWRWVNDGKMDLSIGWETGQPSNAGKGEHCCHYWEQVNLALNDAPCSEHMYCVCQIII